MEYENKYPDDFFQFVSRSNGLFWRLKTGEKRIEFLNDNTIPAFANNQDVGQLLLDLVYAQKVVVESDFFRFKMLVKAMREGKEASGIFRLTNKQGLRRWLRMKGLPGTVDPTFYYGSILDITDDVSFINHLQEKDRDSLVQPGKVLDSSVLDREQFKQKLVDAISGKNEMEQILDTLLTHQYGKLLFDAVLYADIYADKRRVDVYARGESFAPLKQGTPFNYEGTVSQAIRENRLPFLILQDTLLSARPIDWALFIPHGIRSYFAKPFFRGPKLRTLLMFCSTEPNRFSEKDMDIYELYYPAFLHGLKNWRNRKKHPH